MAEPVLLISSDPFLGASLEAVARGRLQIARLDPTHRPPAWPATPSTTVVVDVTTRQRDPIHTWVRRHHLGPLVILLKPGERDPALPPDPWRVVVARPFRLIELVGLLERSPKPPAGPPAAESQVPEPEMEPEEDEDEGGEEGEAEGEEHEGDDEEHEGDDEEGEEDDEEGEREPQAPGGGPPLGRVADRGRFGATLSTPPPRLSTPPPRPSAPAPRPSTSPPRMSTPPPRMSTPRARMSARAFRLSTPLSWPGWRGWRVAARVLVGVLVVLLLAGAG